MRIIDDAVQRLARRTTRLIVAPHADDEALGCGGLLAKYGPDSAVVVLARPDDVRYAELVRARAVLGYAELYLLDLVDGSVGDDMHDLVGQLDSLLSACRPEELYLPYPSAHQDHIAAYEAGMRTARLSMTEGHWFPPSVLVYDVPAYDVSLYPSDLRWNVFESLERQHVDAKARAVEAYDSQRVTGPHPANDVRQQAASHGSARRVAWAERYALVRAVRATAVPAPREASEPIEALVQTLPPLDPPLAEPVGAGRNGHRRVLPS